MIIVCGPTGVGKTDFALKLGNYLPVEMINMDVGQFYTPLSIGTAKPDLHSLSIPHHLFDIVDTPSNYTVTTYRKEVVALIDSLCSADKVPLLVGGSGFYLKSLLFPPKADSSSSHALSGRRDKINYSWELLREVDPQRAHQINPSDTYRITRALDIWFETGKKPSEYSLVYDPPAPFDLVFLFRERADLYQRINERVVAMIDAGWIEEVRLLIGTPWEPFILEKKIIGYSEIIHYLKVGGMSKTDLVEEIQKKTRHYAKRQITFYRMLEREIKKQGGAETHASTHSINLTFDDHDLYIKQLVQDIKSNIR